MNDSAKQQTKSDQFKGIISDLHSLSIDVRDKALELTNAPVPDKEPSKDVEAASDNLGNELVSSLRNVRGILREAYETLKLFN